MSDNFTKFRDTIVEAAGELAGGLGLNRVIGQLYALLYISPAPLSLDELTKQLNMSKGNISVNIRVLEQWDAVRKVWVKGSRKDYYEANLDIPSVVMNRIKSGVGRRLDQGMELLHKAETVLKEDSHSKKDAKVYQARINKIKEWHKLITSLLTHLSTEKIALLKRFL